MENATDTVINTTQELLNTENITDTVINATQRISSIELAIVTIMMTAVAVISCIIVYLFCKVDPAESTRCHTIEYIIGCFLPIFSLLLCSVVFEKSDQLAVAVFTMTLLTYISIAFIALKTDNPDSRYHERLTNLYKLVDGKVEIYKSDEYLRKLLIFYNSLRYNLYTHSKYKGLKMDATYFRIFNDLFKIHAIPEGKYDNAFIKTIWNHKIIIKNKDYIKALMPDIKYLTWYSKVIDIRTKSNDVDTLAAQEAIQEVIREKLWETYK